MSPTLPHEAERIDLARRVQTNLIEYHRLFAPDPDVVFADEDIVFIACPGLPGSKVLGTNLTSRTDQRIARTLDEVGRRTTVIDWLVFPSCAPRDLGARLGSLAVNGWVITGEPGGPGGIWMLADPGSAPAPVPPPPGIRVRRVDGPSSLAQWEAINLEGFGSSEAGVLRKAFSPDGLPVDVRLILYVGFLGDTAVTSSALFMAGGIAGVYNVSTPARFRRRGFASAVTRAAMLDASLGSSDVYLQSSPVGEGVYRRLGFSRVDFGIREYTFEKLSIR